MKTIAKHGLRGKAREAALWIAQNDEPTLIDSEQVAQQVTVALIADLYGYDVMSLAGFISQLRQLEATA